MVPSVRRITEETATSIEDRGRVSLPAYPTEVGSSSGLHGGFARSHTEARVRYGESEAGLIARTGEPTTDIIPYGIGSKDTEIHGRISKCSDLLQRMLESEDIIERENLYRTLNEYLGLLFELRSSRERAFGHLLVLILGITQHTTSEFFSGAQLAGVQRAVNLISKTTIAESDLRDARRLLAAAGFDLLRPLRGVFEDV